MEVKKVGIAGLGIMGRGIAEACLSAGYEIVVFEMETGLLKEKFQLLKNSMEKLARMGRFTQEALGALPQKLKGTTDLDAFKDCDLVIEAIPEDLKLKQALFTELDRICLGSTILATNTSCLSVAEIGRGTKHAERVVGIHFFNPVQLMKLVEIVKTPTTSEDTLKTARAFAESLGKTVVVAPDSPGFIVNRLLMAFLSEAMRLYEGGEASAEDIDKAVTLGLNHPMGPFKLADFIGLDTALYIAKTMHTGFKEPHFAPPEILKKMVAEGKLGRKSGRGFYQY